jgi:general secretion pathway protein D
MTASTDSSKPTPHALSARPSRWARSALSCMALAALIALGAAQTPIVHAQGDATMTVDERDEDDKAVKITLDFVNAEVQQLLKFLQTETNLTIIAAEEDVQGKKLSLLNLKEVTVEEAIEKVKSGLMQFGLTTIRTDSTMIITTVEKAVKMKVPVTTGADPESIPDSDQVITHVIPLQFLDADRLAGQIKPMTSDPAVIFGDQSSNTLVITDVASNIRRVATLLAGMDAVQSTALEVAVIQINNTDVQDIEDALEDLYGRARENTRRSRDERRSSSQTQGEVNITSTEETNQLIVQASAANIKSIRDLITILDTAPSMQMEFRVVRLKYATAEDVVEDLKEILEGESSNDRNRPWWERGRRDQGGDTIQGIAGEVRIAGDDRLNGIIIGTDPRNYPIIQTLIDAIDQADQPGEEIKIYFLENADATTLVANVTELVEGQEEEDDTPWWWNDRRGDDGPTEGVFGLRGVVNLTADTRLNAIVAATSSSNLLVLDDLVKRLDVSMPDQEWGTKIIELKFGDAENVANILTSVYQGSSGNNQRGGFFSFMQRNNQRAQARGSLAGNVVAEAYPTINAVIVSTSTARNFVMIEDFVRQLDVPTPEGQREVTRVFNLEYSTATQLEGLLNNLWEGDNQGGGFNFGRAITRGFRPEQNDINSLNGKVRIFSDDQTNSLVVTTSQRYLKDVEALIRELDIVRGQVWIDITILELTLDDTTKLGLEMELTERRLFGADAFGKNRAPGSNPLTGAFSADLGLGREASGFSLSMATQEYMAFLHTLMRRNQVRTLSRVPLYVRDNEEATFTSGRDIPYLQSAQTSEFTGNQIFGFDFLEDIGINITITPHIARRSATGDGKRTIGLDITQVTASNFLEFTSFDAPLVEDSSISTYIDAQDGQQIVIGGLKKQKRQEVEEKVPILGDLPLIGSFFKRTEDVTQDTEVVVVITPHIVDINDSVDRARLETLQRDRFGSEEEGVLDPVPAD